MLKELIQELKVVKGHKVDRVLRVLKVPILVHKEPQVQ